MGGLDKERCGMAALKKVIAATYDYDKNARRPSDQFGAEMRAIIELMRWTGLRIGGAPYVREIAA
jgi:hypothetical protein